MIGISQVEGPRFIEIAEADVEAPDADAIEAAMKRRHDQAAGVLPNTVRPT